MKEEERKNMGDLFGPQQLTSTVRQAEETPSKVFGEPRNVEKPSARELGEDAGIG